MFATSLQLAFAFLILAPTWALGQCKDGSCNVPSNSSRKVLSALQEQDASQIKAMADLLRTFNQDEAKNNEQKAKAATDPKEKQKYSDKQKQHEIEAEKYKSISDAAQKAADEAGQSMAATSDGAGGGESPGAMPPQVPQNGKDGGSGSKKSEPTSTAQNTDDPNKATKKSFEEQSSGKSKDVPYDQLAVLKAASSPATHSTTDDAIQKARQETDAKVAQILSSSAQTMEQMASQLPPGHTTSTAHASTPSLPPTVGDRLGAQIVNLPQKL